MQLHSNALTALCGLILLLSAGCGASYKEAQAPEAPKDAVSAADYLNKWPVAVQAPSLVKVKAGSAKDVGEGKVRFVDIQNQNWEVTATKEGDSYRFGEPKRAK